MRWGGIFDIDAKKTEIAEEELKTQDPEFWNDPKTAELTLKKIKQKKFWVNTCDAIQAKIEDLQVLFEFFKEGEVEEAEIESNYLKTIEGIEELELKNMLSSEEDNLDAILQITAVLLLNVPVG